MASLYQDWEASWLFSLGNSQLSVSKTFFFLNFILKGYSVSSEKQLPAPYIVSYLLAFCCAGSSESTAVLVQFHRKQSSCSLGGGAQHGERGLSHLFLRCRSELLGLSLVPVVFSAVPPECIPRLHLVPLRWHLSRLHGGPGLVTVAGLLHHLGAVSSPPLSRLPLPFYFSP